MKASELAKYLQDGIDREGDFVVRAGMEIKGNPSVQDVTDVWVGNNEVILVTKDWHANDPLNKLPIHDGPTIN